MSYKPADFDAPKTGHHRGTGNKARNRIGLNAYNPSDKPVSPFTWSVLHAERQGLPLPTPKEHRTSPPPEFVDRAWRPTRDTTSCDFLDDCRLWAENSTFCGFKHEAYKAFIHCLSEALATPAMRRSMQENPKLFQQHFPSLLQTEFLRAAQKIDSPGEDGASKHSFMFDTADSGEPMLTEQIQHSLGRYAKDCIANFWPQHEARTATPPQSAGWRR